MCKSWKLYWRSWRDFQLCSESSEIKFSIWCTFCCLVAVVPLHDTVALRHPSLLVTVAIHISLFVCLSSFVSGRNFLKTLNSVTFPQIKMPTLKQWIFLKGINTILLFNKLVSLQIQSLLITKGTQKRKSNRRHGFYIQEVCPLIKLKDKWTQKGNLKYEVIIGKRNNMVSSSFSLLRFQKVLVDWVDLKVTVSDFRTSKYQWIVGNKRNYNFFHDIHRNEGEKWREVEQWWFNKAI